MLLEFAERHKFKIMDNIFQEATEQTVDMDLPKRCNEERD